MPCTGPRHGPPEPPEGAWRGGQLSARSRRHLVGAAGAVGPPSSPKQGALVLADQRHRSLLMMYTPVQ